MKTRTLLLIAALAAPAAFAAPPDDSALFPATQPGNAAPAQVPAPAAPTSSAPAAAPVAGSQAPIVVNNAEGAGTTLVGDRDSPIGLYLFPWRNTTAEAGLERPARLLQESMLPVDRDEFSRQTDYYDKLAAHRAAQSAAPTPAH